MDERAILLACRSAALAGAVRPFPHQIAHVFNGPEAIREPRELHPAFYGCYDLHSAIHAHWTILAVGRLLDEPHPPAARALLDAHLNDATIGRETSYLQAPGRAGFETPYGMAWALQLQAELATHPRHHGLTWTEAARPFAALCAERLLRWTERLLYPVRGGEHHQTAFSLILALDYARAIKDEALAASIAALAQRLVLSDPAPGPEPGGLDFLSPSLAAAELAHRLLEPEDFAAWLDRALPEPRSHPALRLIDRPEAPQGRHTHLIGLELSRAWMLAGIAERLPPDEPRREVFRAASRAHRERGLASLGGGFDLAHWIGTFAVMLIAGERGSAS